MRRVEYYRLCVNSEVVCAGLMRIPVSRWSRAA
jgi:hypothetical protein